MIALNSCCRAGLVLVSFSVGLTAQSTARHAPPGWNRSERGGVESYVPTDLKPDESLEVAVFAPDRLGGSALNVWLDRWAADKVPGRFQAPVVSTSSNEGKSATANVAFADGGRQLVALFVAMSLDGERVRALRIVVVPKAGLLSRYESGIKALTSELARVEATTVVASQGNAVATPSAVQRDERSSPGEDKSTKADAATESARFKWVTEPGRGVSNQQVAAVLLSFRQVYEIGGLQLYQTPYLLLTDGSAYRGLPCPPDQLDVTASRQHEPGNWGRWRQQGTKYELQFRDRNGLPGAWAIPSMATVTLPGRNGEHLDGRFESVSSYQVPYSSSSVSYRGIAFSRDGRFITDFTNLVGGSTGFGDQRITTQAVANDSGSSSAVAGPNFGGGTSSKSKSALADRSGSYEIGGYVLVLRYDNGKVERLPFFFNGADRTDLWFRGAVHSVPKQR